jgi:hypothetical protein
MTNHHLDVRTPRDVPELRNLLVDCWLPGGVFAATSVIMPNTTLTQHEGARPEYAWHLDNLPPATLYWVSAPMCDLLSAAEHTVPDDTVLERELVPQRSGLVVFEKPLVGIDAQRDSAVRVDAMCWGPVRLAKLQNVIGGAVVPITPLHLLDAVGMVSYSRHNADEGLSSDALMHALNTGAIDQAVAEDRGGGEFSLHGDIWAWLGRGDWLFDTSINHRETPYTDQAFASITEDRRRLAALWLLLSQPGMVSMSVSSGSRGERRRAQRGGSAAPDVAIIDIARRHASATAADVGPPTGRHHHVRYPVSGHWRQQAYGEARAYRRPTWIAAHWRGPDDAPISNVEHVRVFRGGDR